MMLQGAFRKAKEDKEFKILMDVIFGLSILQKGNDKTDLLESQAKKGDEFGKILYTEFLLLANVVSGDVEANFDEKDNEWKFKISNKGIKEVYETLKSLEKKGQKNE